MSYTAQGDLVTGPKADGSFRHATRLREDTCEQETRDLQNLAYWHNVMFAPGARTCAARDIAEDSAHDHQMHLDSATGVLPDCIDRSSEMLMGMRFTNDGRRQQLPKRVFTAVPALVRGEPDLDLESRLVHGHQTPRAGSVRGASTYDRSRMPMLDCLARQVQDPTHLIEAWTRGGESTREEIC